MNAPTRTGPTIKRGKSDQTYRTPPDLIDAVCRRFGPLEYDLAAHASNALVPRWYGPDHPHRDCRDALAIDWSELPGLLWCNPPFDPIAPWLKKAATCRHRPGWTLVLAPAAVGAEWFARHVEGKALVIVLRPRVVFVGQTHGYPRDLMLAAYGFGVSGFSTWRWDATG